MFNFFKKNKKISIFDVSRYIVEKLELIEKTKLHSLCYFCQAWNLNWTGKQLFNEDFEACESGAVCPELRDKVKGFYYVSKDEIVGDSSKLSQEDKDTIDIVLTYYGNVNNYTLAEKIKKEEPWCCARMFFTFPTKNGDYPKIDKKIMKKYYRRIAKKSIKNKG